MNISRLLSLLSHVVCAASFAVLSCAVACRPSSAMAPLSPLPFSVPVGAWTGSMIDERHGVGTLRLFIVDDQGSSQGSTWDATFPGQTGIQGRLTAIQDGALVHLGLSCPGGGTALSTVSLRSGQMSGSYAGVDCRDIARGSISVTRE